MTGLRGVVLVEGNSDRVALHAVAERSGRDLAAEGIEVIAMGGITNTRAMASRYGPQGLGLSLAGLYDAADEAKLQHGLVTAGLGDAAEPDGLAALGFYKCSAVLEDELIRALGVEAVEAVIEAAGETRSRSFLPACPPSAPGRGRRCSGDSLEFGPGAKRVTRRCWSRRWSPIRCPNRWLPCSQEPERGRPVRWSELGVPSRVFPPQATRRLLPTRRIGAIKTVEVRWRARTGRPPSSCRFDEPRCCRLNRSWSLSSRIAHNQRSRTANRPLQSFPRSSWSYRPPATQ